MRPVGEFHCKEAVTGGRMNNRGAIYNAAVMAVGVAIDEKRFVDHALNSPHSGFHALAAGIFDAEAEGGDVGDAEDGRQY